MAYKKFRRISKLSDEKGAFQQFIQFVNDVQLSWGAEYCIILFKLWKVSEFCFYWRLWVISIIAKIIVWC
jgi:hypothetical protein